MSTEAKRRKPWLAGLLSLAFPGLGQIYNGRPVAGLIAWLGPLALLILGGMLALSSLLGLVAITVLALVWLPGNAAHAFWDARRRGEITLRWYNRWYVYLLLVAVFAMAWPWVVRPLSGVRYRTYYMPSGSMEPTLQVGDYIVTDRRAYRFRAPHRGEILVSNSPENPQLEITKRCVAVGGDVVEIRDKRLSVNGKTLSEPYAIYRDPQVRSASSWFDPLRTRDQFGPSKVPPESCFLLGDNRDNSFDSRFWGPVEFDLVRAKPLYIYWSSDLSRIGRKIQ